MKTTRYFEEQVLRKQSYMRWQLCESVLADIVRCEEQPDGRVRYWEYVEELGDKALRVVPLEDIETVHNALPDRNFQKDRR